MQFDGYIRVSRVGGRSGVRYISPDLQRDAIMQWAALRGHTIAEWHTDEDETGRQMRRPGLDEAMRRCQAGETGGIVVAKLDRFARSVAGAAAAWETLEKAGAAFAAVDVNIDTTDAVTGTLLRNIFMALAQWESQRLGASWNAARGEAVERGVHISAFAPTGYVRGADGVLEVDAETAPHIRRAFELRADGASLSTVAAYLEAAGVPTPLGSSSWAHQSIARLLANRVYLGEARSGEFELAGAHPAVVDAETFERAQSSRPRATPRNGGEGYLLAGLLRCAGCRYIMPGANVAGVHKYRCRRNHPGGKCPACAAILGSRVDEYVRDLVCAAVENERARLRGDADSSPIRAATDALELAKRRLVAYLGDEEVRDIVGHEQFQAGARVRQDRIVDAERALADLESANLHVGQIPDDVRVRDWWDAASMSDRRELLAGMVDAVMVRRLGSTATAPLSDRVRVLWRGEGPADLPRRGAVRNDLVSWPWPENDAPSDTARPASL